MQLPNRIPGLITEDPVDRRALMLITERETERAALAEASVEQLDRYWLKRASELMSGPAEPVDRLIEAVARAEDREAGERARELLEIAAVEQGEDQDERGRLQDGEEDPH